MKNSPFSALPIGTVSAVFLSREDARKTHDDLILLGYTDEEISILMSDETLNSYQKAGEQNLVQERKPVPPHPQVLKSYANKFLSWLGVKKLGKQKADTMTLSTELQDSLNEVPKASILIEEQQVDVVATQEGGIIISVDPKNLFEMMAVVDVFKKNNGRDILGDDGYSSLD